MELISIFASIWLAVGSVLGFAHPVDVRHVKEIQVSASHVAHELYTNENVTITTDDAYRYIASNGLADHTTGVFPNSGNPNTISVQQHLFRVALNPTYTEEAIDVQVVGVALNGIPIEPGTAERNKSWRIEALQDQYDLGLDEHNAHVQPDGTYHYHGIPVGLIDMVTPNEHGYYHIGYAADGHRLLYKKGVRTSYQLREGIRADIGGAYDGTYTQDFAFTADVGDLDDCNGMFLESGEYVYFLTEDFPYAPRCLHGLADESFDRALVGESRDREQHNRDGVRKPPQPPHHQQR